MSKVTVYILNWFRSLRLSLFEKVILVNSIMLIGEALAALWVTSHHLESHHYLIDTLFLVFATLSTIWINIILLRASFKPFFSLLTTIREVSTGKLYARAEVPTSTREIDELAQAFNSMLDRLEAARREQTMLILQAQEDERRRIGMELHDEAGQNLTALLIHAEILNQSFQYLTATEQTEQAQKHLADELQQLTRLTQMTLENIRILAQQLRPSVLDDLGLQAAFRWLVEDSGQRLHLKVELEIEETIRHIIDRLPPAYGTALFRIAQESLTNVARHALAQHVTISLMLKNNNIVLTVSDDGNGYDQTKLAGGSGVLGMRERATSLGGTLLVKSCIGKGTTVQASVPLPERLATPSQNQLPEGNS